MGTTKSKPIEKISYKSRLFPNLITINLSESFEYPPRPHKEELEVQFSQILQEIQIISEDQALIEHFPKTLKWKLICRHRDFMSKNLSSLAEVDKSEAHLMIEKIKERSSLADLKLLSEWICKTSRSEINVFYDYRGMKIIFELLEVSELCSRNSAAVYLKQIELLRIILMLTKLFEGCKEIMKIPKSIALLFLNFNELHVEITGVMFEILDHLLWETDNDAKTLNLIFEAIEKYKNENNLQQRFEIFLRILKNSKNIIMIDNILLFIINLISAPIDLDKRRALKAEFRACGIEDILQSLKEKINKKEFSLEDCTYQKTKAIIDNKFDNNKRFLPKTFTISEFADREERISDYDNYSKDRLKNKNKNYLDDLMRFRKEAKNSLSNKDKPDNNQENVLKTFTRTATYNEKPYFLTESDHELFEELVKRVSNQIEAFEKCDEENSNASQQKHLDFNNPLQLFQELKENAVKIEAYPQLIMIFQKMGSISNKNFFIFLEETVKEIKEILEEKPDFSFPASFAKLLKDSQKYEDLQSKFESLQLSFANQEKLIAKLKAEKEKEIAEAAPQQNSPPIIQNPSTLIPGPPPIIPGPPPLINTTNTTPPPLIPAPPILTNNPPPLTTGPPPPLINLVMGGPPAPSLGLPALNLLMGNKNVPKEKEKKKPKVLLKNLMWNVVPPAKIKDTIWEKVDDSKVALDVESIEREFVNNKAKTIEKDDEKGHTKKEEINKISLLPPEKAKNIEIVLGKLKMDFNVLAKALLKCDEKVLSLSTLESMIAIIPNEVDLKPLREFDGEKETLANPEKFLFTLMDIPCFYERLQSMKFALVYEELLDDIELKLNVLSRVWSGVHKDPLFLEIMQYILAVGNYLNGTSARGGAYGFKLDCLNKLSDIKTANGRKNLLCFLIEKIEKDKGKTLIDKDLDLGDFDMAAKLPISQLTIDLTEIKRGSKYISSCLQAATNENEDLFETKFNKLSAKIEKILKTLEEKIKQCENSYEFTANFLCENTKESSEKLGDKLFKFWYACRNAKRMIIKEEENQRKQEETNKKNEEKQKLQDSASKVVHGTPNKVLQKFEIDKNMKPFGGGEGGNNLLEVIKHKRMSKILKINEEKK